MQESSLKRKQENSPREHVSHNLSTLSEFLRKILTSKVGTWKQALKSFCLWFRIFIIFSRLILKDFFLYFCYHKVVSHSQFVSSEVCEDTYIILSFLRRSCHKLLWSSRYLQPIKAFHSFLLMALKYSERGKGKKKKKRKILKRAEKCFVFSS